MRYHVAPPRFTEFSVGAAALAVDFPSVLSHSNIY